MRQFFVLVVAVLAVLLLAACEPDPPVAFHPGDIVKSRLDGRKGMVTNTTRAGVYVVRFAVPGGTKEPYAIQWMREFELERGS